jgi:hypothetical protein
MGVPPQSWLFVKIRYRFSLTDVAVSRSLPKQRWTSSCKREYPCIVNSLKAIQCVNIMFLDINHRPDFIWKHLPVYFSKHVSETGFCLRLLVKPTHLGPIDLLLLWRNSPISGLGLPDQAPPFEAWFQVRDPYIFYGERSSASRQTPNLEDQGISFSLDHPLPPVRHGWPYQ